MNSQVRSGTAPFFREWALLHGTVSQCKIMILFCTKTTNREKLVLYSEKTGESYKTRKDFRKWRNEGWKVIEF